MPGRSGSTAAPNEIPTIRSVMTPSPLSVSIDATVRNAEDLMIDHDVRHLPVLEGDDLVGVVSDRDIAFTSNVPDPKLVDRLRVRDVCSLDVYAVGVEERLDVVLAQMAKRRLGSAVVTERGRIAGVFTATDACRCFADWLRSAFATPPAG